MIEELVISLCLEHLGHARITRGLLRPKPGLQLHLCANAPSAMVRLWLQGPLLCMH